MTAVALLYGSLYPFRFSADRSPFLLWSRPAGLAAIRDYVLNVAIYLPLGFLLASSLPGSPTIRIVSAAVVSFFFSGAIETAQAFDRGRISSSIDLLLNTVGGTCGALVSLLAGWRIQQLTRFSRNAGPTLLIALALASHLYPFFPNIYRDLLMARLRALPHPFPLADLLFAAAQWLAVRVLLSRIFGTPRVTLYLTLAALSVPAGLLIIDQSVTAASLLGAVAAIVVGHFWHPAPRTYAPFLLAAVIGREITPFHFSSPPRPFSWIPFGGFLESLPGSVLILFDKLFFYGAAVWMWDPDAGRPVAVGGAIALLVAGLEWLQRWLPGRTPEITDALLVFGMSGLAYGLARHPASHTVSRTAGKPESIPANR